MVLAKDEVVVKDWEYAKSIVKSGRNVVETPLLSVGAVSLSGKAKKQGSMKVSVNMESAKEIVETIGALIVENQ